MINIIWALLFLNKGGRAAVSRAVTPTRRAVSALIRFARIILPLALLSLNEGVYLSEFIEISLLYFIPGIMRAMNCKFTAHTIGPISVQAYLKSGARALM